MEQKNRRRAKKGVSMRGANLLMAFAMLAISVLLLVATFSVKAGYSRLREDTEDYIQWQQDAYGLQTGSDELTEQVRCFVETGDRTYLDSYFDEVNITRHRDKALARVREIAGDSPAVTALEAAMAESVSLMDREYYAMRLAIEARGGNLADYPQAVRDVAVAPEYANLPAAQKASLARSMVFDEVYRAKKEAISENMQACLAALAEEMDARQAAATEHMDDMLHRERMLIVTVIIITVCMMLLTLLLVISPLLRAVVYIRADEPIPVKGSKEFQFLARTYNLMYEANREQKEQLAYEATHDQLTGIYNRHGYDFFQHNADWERSALVLFDVDRFKQVNDSFGHETGDRVLVKVADALKSSFRSQDYVCRIGGDEFAVIMVHTNARHADLIYRKVESINALLAEEGDGLPPIHVSCGAAYGAQTGETEGTFRAADAALYRVKRAGGNGCEVSVPA